MEKTNWAIIDPKECEFCGIFFWYHDNEKLSRFARRCYCGNSCKLSALFNFNTGKKAHNNKRVIRICKQCGKEQLVSPVFAKRPFCSRRCMAHWQSENVRSENHWNWQGGITEIASRDVLYPGYKEWRKEVFKRDGYKCVLCGCNKSGELEAHHIKTRSKHKELILDISNGLTVCKLHHKEIHYGTKRSGTKT